VNDVNLYLFAGYSVVCVIVVVYAMLLGDRQRKLEAEVRLLEETVARQGARSA
jgi:CcmD family protein